MPPPAAIAPDLIPPAFDPFWLALQTPWRRRVPAIVASPYSQPNAVTNVLHGHTSFLATVEKKWNLPRLTDRDANAKTVTPPPTLQSPAFLNPPTSHGPAPVGAATTP